MGILQLIKSLKPTRTEHWMMLSFFLYTISMVLSGLVSPFISKIFLYLGCTSFLLIMLTRWKGIPLTGLTKMAFLALLVWSICLTVQMLFFFDLDSVMTGGGVNRGLISKISYLYDSLPFFPHLVPLSLCCFAKKDRIDISYFIRVALVLGLIYVVVLPFVTSNLMQRSLVDIVAEETATKDATLGIRILAPATLLIFLKQFISRKQWMLFLALFIANLLITIYLGRRGGSLMGVVYLATMWMIYTNNGAGANRIQTFFFGLVMLGAAYLLFTNTSDSLFGYILERGMNDNRSDRNFDLIVDMNATNDWLTGRGWFGQYYDSVYGYRGSIETGVLALLLRGGFLYLIPYVLLLLLCFINGVFKSNNILCKSFGALAGLQILYLYPYGWPMFSLEYFFLWIGVFVCNNAYYRNMSDIDVKKMFFKI